MELVPLSIIGGWASGISAYATLLIVGLLGRGEVIDAPDALQRTDVLLLVAVLTGIEFIADKVPYIDSVWDSVHTVIRPVIAGMLGALAAGDADTLGQSLAAGAAALIALITHTSKASLRLAVNSSPEPASNVAVSFAEEASVAGVLLLAVEHPWLAAGMALTLLALALGLVIWLTSRVRRGWRRMWDRLLIRAPR